MKISTKSLLKKLSKVEGITHMPVTISPKDSKGNKLSPFVCRAFWDVKESQPDLIYIDKEIADAWVDYSTLKLKREVYGCGAAEYVMKFEDYVPGTIKAFGIECECLCKWYYDKDKTVITPSFLIWNKGLVNMSNVKKIKELV